MEKPFKLLERRGSQSAPNSPKGSPTSRDKDQHGIFLKLLDNTKLRHRLELEEKRIKRLGEVENEGEETTCHCGTDNQKEQLKGFTFDIDVPAFDIPVSNHTPLEVIRLFPEARPTYRSLTICGTRVNANQKIHFLEICYGRISAALGLKVNSASLAWELCSLVKSGGQCQSPAQQVMNALTFNHWANAWVHILPRHFPELFNRERKCLYQAKATTNTQNVPMSDYAVTIQKGKIRCVQRKSVTINRRQKNTSVAQIVVELHSLASVREICRPKSFAKWTGMLRIYPPMFELNATASDQRNVMEILKPTK